MNFISQKKNIELVKSEQQRSKQKNWRWKSALIVVASILVIIFAFIGIKGMTELDDSHSPEAVIGNGETIQQPNDITVDQQKEGIEIPAIKLPQNIGNADMIGLVVYNGKIYTQTQTSVGPQLAKQLKGEKLGTTKESIDEWSSQSDYSQELASNIGVQDIFAVNGYNTDFRIMTYLEYDDGNLYTEFFECLNGFTVYSGADIIAQLNIVDNIEGATYETYSDWYYSTEKYNPIADLELLNTFVTELNDSKPYDREIVGEELGDFRNNEQYRRLTLGLRDGTEVNLFIIREGYIIYGNTSVYFKLEGDTFNEIWALLQA
ncbi:MAG TPA: hypothetical protein IAA29_00315 [Candidatus Paenibacillus intestinavium]|nr:hypothetical protein [Candidatus Paenibacillus intestinavium]